MRNRGVTDERPYSNEMAARIFALRHDNGRYLGDAPKADIVLLGPHRSLKTKIALALADQGITAANAPFIEGRSLPWPLVDESSPLVIGIMPNPKRIWETDLGRVHGVRTNMALRRACTEQRWPCIKIGRRSVKQIAKTVAGVVKKRRKA